MLCLVTKSKLRVVRELTEKEADAIRDPLFGDSTAELALAVLRKARENDLWLRCDCRIGIDDDPLVTPCRKPMGAGYSWRVLRGENHPKHYPDCVFYRESREERSQKNWRRAARSCAGPGGGAGLPEGPRAAGLRVLSGTPRGREVPAGDQQVRRA